MNEEHKQFLTENCNRLKYGVCHNLGCLRRGNYLKGTVPPDYDKATCVPYEIFKILEKSHE
jgi:hypothetical protein